MKVLTAATLEVRRAAEEKVELKLTVRIVRGRQVLLDGIAQR